MPRPPFSYTVNHHPQMASANYPCPASCQYPPAPAGTGPCVTDHSPSGHSAQGAALRKEGGVNVSMSMNVGMYNDWNCAYPPAAQCSAPYSPAQGAHHALPNHCSPAGSRGYACAYADPRNGGPMYGYEQPARTDGGAKLSWAVGVIQRREDTGRQGDYRGVWRQGEPVPHLREDIRPSEHAQDPPAHALRRKAVPLSDVSEVILAGRQSDSAPAHA